MLGPSVPGELHGASCGASTPSAPSACAREEAGASQPASGCQRRMSSMARAASASSGLWPTLCSSKQISRGLTRPSPLRSRLSKTRRTSISTRASLTRYHLRKSSKLILPSQLRLMLLAAAAACASSVQPSVLSNCPSSLSSMKPLLSSSSLSNVSRRLPATCVTTTMPAVSRTLASCLSSSTMPARKLEGCRKWRLLRTEHSPAASTATSPAASAGSLWRRQLASACSWSLYFIRTQ
mmetsp:Transcript_18568/g.37829  ORF Transcript_18568/g.37829 Transcript_18568/m.37829 type:complete len:238 (-) Transcript_18568:796-1509(-)